LRVMFTALIPIIVIYCLISNIFDVYDEKSTELKMESVLDSLEHDAIAMIYGIRASLDERKAANISKKYGLYSIVITDDLGEIILKYDQLNQARSQELVASKSRIIYEEYLLIEEAYDGNYDDFEKEFPKAIGSIDITARKRILFSEIVSGDQRFLIFILILIIYGLGWICFWNRYFKETLEISAALRELNDNESTHAFSNWNGFILPEFKRMVQEIITASEFINNSSTYYASTLHEIRNPLNALSLHHDLIIDELQALADTKSELYKDGLKQINSHVKSSSCSLELLNNVLHNVFDSEALSLGDTLELSNEIFDIYELAESCINLLEISDYDVSDFQVHRPKLALEGKRYFYGDKNRIKQIFINLLSNSFKYTNEGCVIVKLSTLRVSEDKFEIKIIIRDTGVGIDASQLNFVFQPYFRANIEKDIHRSRGLGLFITKSIVESLGGEITIDSKVGIGTSVETTLVLSDASKASSIDNADEYHEFAKLQLSTMNILIVDDQPINVKAVEGILKKYEANILSVYDGNQAIEAIKNKHFDLVLMDLAMPNCGGIEATTEIRKTHPNLPIVALTGSVDEHTRLSCIRVGINDYLSKPISKNKLIKAIYKVISVDSKCIDLEYVANEYDHSILDIKRDLSAFLLTYQNTPPLSKYFESNNIRLGEEISDFSHKLVNASGYIGANKLRSVAKSLELVPEDKEELDNLIEDVNSELTKVVYSVDNALYKFQEANTHE